MARVYGERKRNFVGQHFWAGDFSSTRSECCYSRGSITKVPPGLSVDLAFHPPGPEEQRYADSGWYPADDDRARLIPNPRAFEAL